MLLSLTRQAMVTVALMVIFLMIVTPALAGNGNGNNGNANGNSDGNSDGNANGNSDGTTDDGGTGNPNSGGDPVPEIDPASAVCGVVLLAGGFMLLTDSRRRNK